MDPDLIAEVDAAIAAAAEADLAVTVTAQRYGSDGELPVSRISRPASSPVAAAGDEADGNPLSPTGMVNPAELLLGAASNRNKAVGAASAASFRASDRNKHSLALIREVQRRCALVTSEQARAEEGLSLRTGILTWVAKFTLLTGRGLRQMLREPALLLLQVCSCVMLAGKRASSSIDCELGQFCPCCGVDVGVFDVYVVFMCVCSPWHCWHFRCESDKCAIGLNVVCVCVCVCVMVRCCRWA